MDMDLSETETLRPVLRSATQTLDQTLDGGPRLQEAAPIKTTSATRRGNLRVALVGAGYVAQFHRDALAETPGVNLVAVWDAAAERARAAARAWGPAPPRGGGAPPPAGALSRSSETWRSTSPTSWCRPISM